MKIMMIMIVMDGAPGLRREHAICRVGVSELCAASVETYARVYDA